MICVPRGDVPTLKWDAFIERHHGGWFWHTSRWIDYSLAYTAVATDCSFAVIDKDELLAIVPLVLSPTHQLVMGGQVTPCPLFDWGTADRPALARMVTQRAVSVTGTTGLPIQLHPRANQPNAEPPATVTPVVTDTYVVDLRDDNATIRARFRKSYKSLINQAERKYVITSDAYASTVEVAHQLHVDVSLRETRPALTWALMGQWAQEGYAFTVLARARDHGLPVGYIYVIVYKQWAYYASSAVCRPNVAHGLQWTAMLHLKELGVPFYELGHSADADAPRKEQGIAHFKAGFGGGTRPWLVVTDRTN